MFMEVRMSKAYHVVLVVSINAKLCHSFTPGDFHHDGAIDAADYVAWRKTGVSPDDYIAWQENFGRTLVGSDSSFALPTPPPALDKTVPEPSMIALAAGCLFFVPLYRWAAKNRC
jgi:hypothetical protein